jgi:hypothetical protein
MPESAAVSPGLFAVLIGIDRYQPNRLPGGITYPSLHGCARDVEIISSFFRTTLRMSDDRIIKLVSAEGADTPHEQLPTYEAIVKAILDVRDHGQAGDEVFIHFSGSGARVRTAFPEAKGADGVDLALVPWNVGDPGWRYLRDKEITALLGALTEKGLGATLVMDCCFTGLPTRGSDAPARGSDLVDLSSQASHTVPGLPTGPIGDRPIDGRDLARTGPYADWLPPGDRCVLLAAALPGESAREYSFDGLNKNGVFTFWLVDALKVAGPGQTYRLLYDRIASRVKAQFSGQTPVLAGNANLRVFGCGRGVQSLRARVLKVDADEGHLTLDAGQARGSNPGAQFAIYPAETSDGYDLRLMSWEDGSRVPTSGNNLVIVGNDNNGLLHIRIFDADGNRVKDTDETRLPNTHAGAISSLRQQLPGLLHPHVLTDDEKAGVIAQATSIVDQIPSDENLDRAGARIGVVEVVTTTADESQAKIVFLSGDRFFRPGDWAVLLSRAAVVLRRWVRLIREDPRPAPVDRTGAIELVEKMLRNSGEGWVEPAEGDQPGDFQVAIDELGNYEITDPTGRPLPNLAPRIVAGETDAASKLVRRLVHLSRYQAVLQLDNASPPRDLKGKLHVTISRAPADYQGGDRPKGVPFEPGILPTVEIGDWVVLTIRNDSRRALNVTALDLEPGWGISQIIPRDEDSEVYEPGEEKVIPFKTSLPTNIGCGSDVIKVFATTSRASFRVLELPSLDNPKMGGSRALTRAARSASSGLDEFLAIIAFEHPSTRDLRPIPSPSTGLDWVTNQVEVQIRRPGQTPSPSP